MAQGGVIARELGSVISEGDVVRIDGKPERMVCVKVQKYIVHLIPEVTLLEQSPPSWAFDAYAKRWIRLAYVVEHTPIAPVDIDDL